jgi:hypothetical protein
LNRTASNSSDASTTTTLASPTKRRQTVQPEGACRQGQSLPRGDAHHGRTSLSGLSSSFETYAQPGRFEREFVEIGELGSGEFGKAMKVRRQDGGSKPGTSGDITAVKKSKRFEGVRHRSAFFLTILPFSVSFPIMARGRSYTNPVLVWFPVRLPLMAHPSIHPLSRRSSCDPEAFCALTD